MKFCLMFLCTVCRQQRSFDFYQFFTVIHCIITNRFDPDPTDFPTVCSNKGDTKKVTEEIVSQHG